MMKLGDNDSAKIQNIDNFNGLGDAYSDTTKGTLPSSGGNRWMVLAYTTPYYGMQLAITFSNNNIYIRNKPYDKNGNTTWLPWRTI